jgi:hypothetical protein
MTLLHSNTQLKLSPGDWCRISKKAVPNCHYIVPKVFFDKLVPSRPDTTQTLFQFSLVTGLFPGGARRSDPSTSGPYLSGPASLGVGRQKHDNGLEEGLMLKYG